LFIPALQFIIAIYFHDFMLFQLYFKKVVVCIILLSTQDKPFAIHLMMILKISESKLLLSSFCQVQSKSLLSPQQVFFYAYLALCMQNLPYFFSP